MKNFWRFFFITILVIGIHACLSQNVTQTGNLSTPLPQPLPSVTPLKPAKLPDWIAEVNPTGEAQPLQQIRVIFKEPLIGLQSLDSEELNDALKYFEITPKIAGQFRFLTPRMVGFQPEQALPKATRFKITIKEGLTDRNNQKLSQDLAWTFNTEPIKLFNLPNSYPPDSPVQPIDLHPQLKFNSNVPLELDSLKDHVKLIKEGEKESISLKFELGKNQGNDPDQTSEERENEAEKFDPSLKPWTYTMIPQGTLEKGQKYRLEFNTGLRPLGGNLPSQTPFVSRVETYSPLTFQGLKFWGSGEEGVPYGRFKKGAAQLKFNNGIIAETARNNIKINPPVKKEPKLVQAYDNEPTINLNPWALEPGKNYTITLGENLKDKFGQTLEKPVNVSYQTGDLAGDIWAPVGLNIFPSGKNLQLNLSAVNLPESAYKAAFKVIEPPDLVDHDSAYPRENQNSLLPSPKSWKEFSISGQKNQVLEVTIPLKEKLGTETGMLAYGIQARTNSYQENQQKKWTEPIFAGLVQLTNLGVFAQWFPDSGMIRVHHLDDGSPATVSVEIYPSQLDSKKPTKAETCFTGKTDNNGTLLLNSSELKKCFIMSPNGSQEGFNKPPELLVIARENKDWAFTRTEAYSGAYNYGIDGGWTDGEGLSRGLIFSDRELYQPGETAWITGMAYYVKKGEIQSAKNTAYQLTLENPDGQKVDLGTQETNEFGTFSIKIPLSSQQKLGFYTLHAIPKNQSNQGSESPLAIQGKIRVAEFKPPNFKVDLKLDKEWAISGDNVIAQSASHYLFGSPVQGGKAKYYITRQKTDFTPKDWTEFSFGRQWFWPEQSPIVSGDVLQTETVLDRQGNGSQLFAIDKELPYPMTYRVDVEVSDISNLSVANSQTLKVLPSSSLIGLKSNFVGDSQKPFPVEVIVTDGIGKLLEGQKVRLELQEMNYSNVTRVVEGSSTQKNQIEYKTVLTEEITSGNQPKIVSLVPPNPGSYRIRANFTNSNNEITATDTQIWITGKSGINWGNRYQHNRLDVKLNKTEYKPGEIATALIQSPYPEGELYFAVIRDKILYQTITKVKGGAPQIQFKVTPEMLPNAAIEAVLVRQGDNLKDDESINNLVSVGFTAFNITLEEQYLQVQVTPEKTELLPGQEGKIALELKDQKGNPVSGQFTVAVVNEAVLQLTGYRFPDVVKTVYAEQPISTRFSDNRPDVILQPIQSPLAKGWGYGGGFSSGLANTRIRQNFQALAYYNGSVLTDQKGQVSVDFKLPDNLTTWRIMVVATDKNLRFGKGENTLITTKPLISNPILPPFARPGDRISLGIGITNKNDQQGTLKINGQLGGVLKFVDNNPTIVNLETKGEPGTKAYHFPMIAEKAGEGEIQFVSQLNNHTDGFTVPFSVQPLEITENVIETGTTQSKINIPLNLNKRPVIDVGGLEISLANTLIPSLIPPNLSQFESESLPFLEPLASRLLITANLQKLSEKYGQSWEDFNLTENALKTLQTLQKLQLPDGGFARFPGLESSDPFLTAYGVHALSFANSQLLTESGETLKNQMISSLKDYLKTTLTDPSKSQNCQSQLCQNQIRLEMLIALGELGDKRNEFLADIYQNRADYSSLTQIKLARYLSQFKDWENEAQSLIKEIGKNINVSGRNATSNFPENLTWMDSQTAIQSEILRLFLTQKTSQVPLTNVVQSLLNLRGNGTWNNLYDYAQALTALGEYSQTETPPEKLNVTVKLDGKKVESFEFNNYKNPRRLITIGTEQLPRQKAELTLEKSGQGTLYYWVNYSYRLEGNQPGRINGLRVLREIRSLNDNKVLAKQGMNPQDLVKLSPGQIFDIQLEIIADHPVNHVMINEPLPAGLEAIDQSLKTANQALETKKDSWGLKYKNFHKDHIVAYWDHLDPGVYSLHYLARSVTSGTYLWPGLEAHLQYAPEEFGRSASTTLMIAE